MKKFENSFENKNRSKNAEFFDNEKQASVEQKLDSVAAENEMEKELETESEDKIIRKELENELNRMLDEESDEFKLEKAESSQNVESDSVNNKSEVLVEVNADRAVDNVADSNVDLADNSKLGLFSRSSSETDSKKNNVGFAEQIFSFFSKNDKDKQNRVEILEKIDEDQDLLVIEDMDNGFEYFFYQLDTFSYENVEYMCLASYEPDLGYHSEPELVIMRTKFDENGLRMFQSIRDRQELEKVFDVFYDRMQESI